MSRNVKDVLALGFIAVIIFLLPALLNDYFVVRKSDSFRVRLNNDFSDCVKNANEDAKSVDWCKRIKESSELAFDSAYRVSDTNFDISFPHLILFMLAIITISLKRKVEDLENK